MITTTCPSCRAPLASLAAAAGQTFRCYRCGTQFVVKGPGGWRDRLRAVGQYLRGYLPAVNRFARFVGSFLARSARATLRQPLARVGYRGWGRQQPSR